MLFFFCGVEVLATLASFLLSQKKYIIDLLSQHNMLDSKPVFSLLAIGTSLTAHDVNALVNATMYHQVVGRLQHIRMTRPDISFAVNKFS